MFLLQTVHTMEPYASPSCFKNRLKRITRLQHTGIQTFCKLSGPMRPSPLLGRQSIYRKPCLSRILICLPRLCPFALGWHFGPLRNLAACCDFRLFFLRSAGIRAADGTVREFLFAPVLARGLSV